MVNTCIPVADSFWNLAKLIQLCKFKNKIKLKKKKILVSKHSGSEIHCVGKLDEGEKREWKIGLKFNIPKVPSLHGKQKGGKV